MDIKKENSRDFIDIFDIAMIIYKRKISIFLISFFVFGASSLYSFLLPNIYKSKTLLMPNVQVESMFSQLGSYSMIANVAGVKLPGESNTKTQEAIERLKSLDFFSLYIMPNTKAEDLFAVSSWNMAKNEFIYNNDIYNSVSKKWVRNFSPPLSAKPSPQELHNKFLSNLSITYFKDTGFISIEYSHKSAVYAKELLDIIIINIDESMRQEDKEASLRAINFLNIQSEENRIAEIDAVISQLLKSQMEALMLASVDENYIFKVIDKPYVPEIKSSPARKLIVVAATFLGLILSSLFIIAMEFSKQRPKQ